MAQAPGIAFMPTTLLNAALGLLPERTLPVRGPDRLAALVPMFDEEVGAGDALASLLAQRVPLDEIVVSINGGRDATPTVVAATLQRAGYRMVASSRFGPEGAPVDWWWQCERSPSVAVVHHSRPVAKADSLNLIVAGGLVTAERLLVLDGDTILDPGFVAAMRDGFYRLSAVRRDGRTAYVLEDVAIQSGAVTSMRPRTPTGAAGLVSAARTAEYAFATLVRRGQVVRWGRGAVFGASRLYTVIGCGFVVRRDALPVPADTTTEDHDLTLSVQGGPTRSVTRRVNALHAEGFRAVIAGVERPLAEVVGDGAIEVRTTPHARFETAAAMITEDPPRLAAYLGQVERWVGGGLENLLKRVLDPLQRRAWAPNARFAVLGAQLENLAGLLLLVAFAASLGSVWSIAGGQAVLRGLATWLVADLAVTGLLVVLGASLQVRARGPGALATAWPTRRRALAGVVALLLLRPLNLVAYGAAATRVVPRFLSRRRVHAEVTKTWVRPRVIVRTARLRTGLVATCLGSLLVAGFAGSAHVTATDRPLPREVWRQLHAGPPVDLAPLMRLPVHDLVTVEVAVATVPSEGPPVPTGPPAGPPADGAARQAAGRADRGAVSLHCPPDSVAGAAGSARALDQGAGAYEPLNPWGVLTLARLAPILALIEEASTAYDLPPALMLQLLLNESYLDPLAVGPTDDYGLSQVTADAVRLLRAISYDPGSPFANDRLFGTPVNLFDPDFSVCAGAAKLAWARQLPHGDDDAVAYARYVNPWHGVVDGQVSRRHRPLVEAFEAVRPMVDALAAAVAAYRRDPDGVAAAERALLDVAAEVAHGERTVEGAYRRASEIIEEARIDDRRFFGRVLSELYGHGEEQAQAGLLADAR